MLGKYRASNQTSFFFRLEYKLNPKHPLYILANSLDWQ